MATSSVVALVCMNVGISSMVSLGMSIGAFILLFVIGKKANSGTGVALTFLFTGLLGGSLGRTLEFYVAMENGGMLVFQALALTAIIFASLTSYTLSRPEKDFSGMGSFLFAGLIVAIIAVIANIFLQLPLLSVIISSVIALIMSGYIIYDTSRIIKHEPNYVMATVSMYLNIFNLFTSILHLLGFMSDD